MNNLKVKCSVFILLICYIVFKGYLFSVKYKSDNINKEYILFIHSLKSISEDKISYNVKLGKILNNSYKFSDNFILNIYKDKYKNKNNDLSKYKSYKYGDVVRINGRISVPKSMKNPGEFDYKRYLYSNNIYAVINTYSNLEIINYNMNIVEKVFSKIYLFKDYISSTISKSMNNYNANIAKAMIYGDTLNLDENIKTNFKEVGVSHLVAVSGSNIGTIIAIITIVLNTIKINKKFKGIICITIIGLFMVIAGMSLSVVRAGIMSIAALLSKILNKKISIYYSLFIALLIILIYSPFAMFNIGMILSFLATLGIIMFSDYLMQALSNSVKRIRCKLIKKIILIFFQSISIIISVQFMILPIEWSFFNSISTSIILSNIITGFLSIPIRVLGTIGILLSIFPIISKYIFSILSPVITIFMCAIEILKNISYEIPTMSLPLIINVIYYILIISIFIKFKLKIKLKNSSRKNNKLDNIWEKYKKIQIGILIILIISIIFVNIYFINFANFVYFFNVGQGDMSYLKVGTESILIDIGSLKSGLAFNTITNYFKNKNISHVNAIILSHMHSDHINGLNDFLRTYKVDKILYADPPNKNKVYYEFIELLKKHNIKSQVVKSGDKLELNNMYIEILLPLNNFLKDKDMLNTNSLVLKVVANNNNLLYMGDATVLAENEILKRYNFQDINILKVGHHGSKTSTSYKFIKTIKPKNAVISCDSKYYGHPHEQVLDILDSFDVFIYLTEKSGAIKFNLK